MSDVDKRGLPDVGSEFPVFRKSITQMVWPGGGAGAAKSQNIALNGVIKRIVMKISAVSEAITVTLTIADDLGNQIFNSGAKADGATYLFDEGELGTDAFCVVGIITVTATPSAEDVNEAMTVDVDFYGI